MKYSFRKYCNLIGFVDVEAENDKDALKKFNKTAISDYKWKTNPTRTDRTTYEVVVDDSLSRDREE